MLAAMQHLNKIEGTALRIHGGIAKGSLIHIHLGSQNDDLRYVLTCEGGVHFTEFFSFLRFD